MAELIDRKKLLQDIEQTVVFTVRTGETSKELRGANKIVDRIKAAPAIEAEPVKHGRWVDRLVRDWRCSECGEPIHKVRNVDGYCYDDKPSYCPNCGARMDGDEYD